MRKRLISLLTERAKFDLRPFLLVGDLGFGVVEEFEGQFPKRFLNVGVSEQAGIGFSAGLAKEYLPFFYSIANFSSFRALEQIRNDVAHEGWPVVIISLGSGFSYGTAGYSHHAIEDAGAVASIMGMDVFTPSCVHEMEHVLSMHWENPRPMYLRLGSAEECDFNHPINPLGLYSTYKDASGGVALLAHGEIVHQALQASELIETDLAIFSIFHYNRLSKELIETLKKFDKIVTLEEHFVEGGFGMRVKASLPITSTQSFKCLGIQEYDSHMSGSRPSMLARVGLDPESIARSVKGFIES